MRSMQRRGAEAQHALLRRSWALLHLSHPRHLILICRNYLQTRVFTLNRKFLFATALYAVSFNNA